MTISWTKNILLGMCVYSAGCGGNSFSAGAQSQASSGGNASSSGGQGNVAGQTTNESGGTLGQNSGPNLGGAETTGGALFTSGSVATGGSSGTSTLSGIGGKVMTGGTASVGGNSNTGGSLATGGKTNTGGVSAGGKTNTGGSVTAGGKTSTGGSVTAGGKTSTGGSVATGGKTNTGGSLSTGGASNTGGMATGGIATSGGQGPVTVTLGERPDATVGDLTYDTDLLSATPTFNYGYAPDFGCNASPVRVGLLKFNTAVFVNQYGHGQVVLAARLHLWTMACVGCQANQGTVVQLFKMNQVWQEVAYPSSQGDGGIPNWTQADIDTSDGTELIVNWLAAGAQPPTRDTTELNHFSPISADTDYVVTLPPSLVQAWLDNPDMNYGMALGISGTVTDTVTFVASDGDQSKSPLLEIDLAPN